MHQIWWITGCQSDAYLIDKKDPPIHGDHKLVGVQYVYIKEDIQRVDPN
jgi:hypothetical protein